ncbi:hypothetical protein TA3x_002299 [Tundrisphaera sp. TA3]|uniref:hypothetical protein n=1 Tax=Tundrisphaera sp. TA3 TaxID=3435775 RepID=UPI003EBC44A7
MRRANRGHWIGPRAEILESRRLMAVSASYLGLTDLDFAGPTASIGPGGVRNLELKVSLPAGADGRGGTLDSVRIEGPDGTRWSFGDQTRADAAIVVDPAPFAPGDAFRNYTLYISPTVQVVDEVTGGVAMVTLPRATLGPTSVVYDPATGEYRHGSPGQTSQLRLSVSYRTAGGGAARDSWATNPALIVAVDDLIGQDLASAPPISPPIAFGAYAATYAGQLPDGRARIALAGLPAGTTIDTSSLVLTDTTGRYWTYGSTNGRWELGASLAYSTDRTAANIDFAPLRDESGTTMTLSFRSVGNATQHIIDVAIPADSGMDLNRRDGGPIAASAPSVTIAPTSAATPNMVSYVDAAGRTQVVDIQTLLNPGSPYRNITMTAGSTGGVYTLDRRLDVRAGVNLKAASPDVTLNFTFSTVVQGAINIYSSHVTLDGFKIRFAQPTVNFTYGGWADATSVAIISNRQDNSQVPRVDLNLLNLDIQAPFVPFGANPSQNYAISTLATFDSGPYASGVISGNTIRGGVVAVQGGPWTISDNKVLGGVAGTVSDTAFSLYSSHDVRISGNLVSNAGADLIATSGVKTGAIDRFLTANNGSYGLTIIGNTVTGNVGLIPPNPGGYSEGNPRNNPEIMVFEGYGKLFEGSLAATRVSSSAVASYDRRVITIARSQTDRFAPGAGPVVLVILNGPLAGTSIPLVQYLVNPDSTNFVLASPLPAGTFDFSLVPAHNHLDVLGNTIDVRGTVSTGLVLSDSILNARVSGNTFLGDRSIERDGNGNHLTSQAIRFEVFVKYDDHRANQYLPIEATIEHNTIIDALGGVNIYVERGFAPSYGRTYGFLRFNDNAFQYSYQNPTIVRTQFADSYARVVSQAIVPHAEASRFLDPSTIRITSSNNTVAWEGVEPPPSYTSIASVTINGVAYGRPAPQPIDPLVTTRAVPPVVTPTVDPPPPTPPSGPITPTVPAPVDPLPAPPTPPEPPAPSPIGMKPPGVFLIPPAGAPGLPASPPASPMIQPPSALLAPGAQDEAGPLPDPAELAAWPSAPEVGSTDEGSEVSASSLPAAANPSAMIAARALVPASVGRFWKNLWKPAGRGRHLFLFASRPIAAPPRAMRTARQGSAGRKAGKPGR